MATTTKVDAPTIRACAPRRMAVVRTVGHPVDVVRDAADSLYASVYALRRTRAWEGRDFEVGALSALWPNAHEAPRHEWLGVWGVEVPPDVTDEELPRKAAGPPVELETWPGGHYAELVHRGSLAKDGSTFERLHGFIADQGYEVDGPHEEQYLTPPDADEATTRVRYRVRPSM